MSRRTRIGPCMSLVRAICLTGDGRPVAVIDVARRIGPHGSLMYGYQTIHRAVRAGLVAYAPPLPGRRGASLILV
jgi:hypothetical protein